jgi:hypothetical protein
MTLIIRPYSYQNLYKFICYIFLLIIPDMLFCQSTRINDSIVIGRYFEGGIVFYIDETGQHGLIVTDKDISSKSEFGCPEMEVYANSMDNGQINTYLINKNCGISSAASQCINLTLNGYDDWYLPSIDELVLLYKAPVLEGSLEIGIYWSSTECKSCDRQYVSWALDVKSGGKRITSYKDKEFHVRAVRKF